MFPGGKDNVNARMCFDGAAFARAVADLNSIPGIGVNLVAPQGAAKLQCGTSGSSTVVIDPKVFDVPSRKVINLNAMWRDANGNFHHTRKPSESWDTNVIISRGNDIPGVSADKSEMIATSLRNFYACESGKNSQACVAGEKERITAVVEEIKIKSGEYVCVEWETVMEERGVNKSAGGRFREEASGSDTVRLVPRRGACKKYGPQTTSGSTGTRPNGATSDKWDQFNPESLHGNPPRDVQPSHKGENVERVHGRPPEAGF